MLSLLKHVVGKSELGILSYSTIRPCLAEWDGGGGIGMREVQGLWEITGAVQILGVYGWVVTAPDETMYPLFGVQTGDDDYVALTDPDVAGGIDGVGVWFGRLSNAATGLAITNNSSVDAFEGNGDRLFAPVIVSKCAGETTSIYFSYATSALEASGSLQHACIWLPVTANGRLTEIWTSTITREYIHD